VVLNPGLGESIEFVELLQRIGWRSELRLKLNDDVLLDDVEQIFRVLDSNALR
jgi:hypothetical protein